MADDTGNDRGHDVFKMETVSKDAQTTEIEDALWPLFSDVVLRLLALE